LLWGKPCFPHMPPSLCHASSRTPLRSSRARRNDGRETCRFPEPFRRDNGLRCLCRNLSSATARHRDSPLLLAHIRWELGDKASLVEDEDAVGEREDFVELE